MKIKNCAHCKKDLNITNYNFNKKGKYGVGTVCKSCKKIYHQKLRKDPKFIEREKKRIRKYYLENKEWYLNDSKKRQKNKRIEYNKTALAYYYKNIHIMRWRSILSDTLSRLKQNKSFPTEKHLKYTANQLKEHLDKLGMDWKADHVDHKIPVSWFKKNTPIYLVNDLRNLQPMKPELNLIKNNKNNSPITEGYFNDIKNYIKGNYLKNLVIQ
jgi:hypothetical protein